MPQVGEKHFSYSSAGYAAAKREAHKTGKPVKKRERSDAAAMAALSKRAKERGIKGFQ